jgi:hypothetical protein
MSSTISVELSMNVLPLEVARTLYVLDVLQLRVGLWKAHCL